MPLIIHRESCCDICLEPFTYEAPRPPHAIPCGHIFCRDCLYTVHPTLCPLCRKPYLPERAKKLITGESSDMQSNSEGLDLLRRLVVLWDVEPQNEDLVALLGEIRSWMGSGNRFEALTKAQEAMEAIISLRTEQAENLRSIKRMQRQIQQWQMSQSLRVDTAAATEESLRERVRELEMQNRQYEGDLGQLQAEITSLRTVPSPGAHNPLPPPPEPVHLEQFAHWYTQYPTADHQMNGHGHVDPSAPNPYSTANGLPSAEQTQPPVPTTSTTSRDRKGKGRAREADQPHSFNVRAPSSWDSKIAEADENQPGPSIAIMPGAPPDKRFVLPSRSATDEQYYAQGQEAQWSEEPVQGVQPHPSWLQPGNGRSESRPIDIYSLVEEYVINGYAHGVSAGYRVATDRGNTSAPPEPSQSHPRSSRLQPPPPPPLPPPSAASAPSRSGFHDRSLSPVTQQQAAMPLTAPLPATSTIPTIPPVHRTSSMSYRLTEATPPSAPPFNSALTTVPLPSSNTTPSSTPGRPSRRRATQPISTTVATESPTTAYIPSPVAGRVSGLRRQSAGITTQQSSPPNAGDPNRVSLASLSSWGTVNTMNPISPSRLPVTEDMLFQRPDEIRSVRDLRLHSFGDDDVGGQRTSVAYSIESLTTGVEAVQLVPEDRQRLRREEGVEDRNHDNATPRARRTSLRSASTAATARPPQHDHQQPPDRRHGTYPSRLSQGAPPQHAPPVEPSGRSSRPQAQAASRARYHRRYEPSRQQQEAVPAAATTGEGFENHRRDGLGNALGLSYMTRSPEISAPTPRVASAAFVQSLSEEGWWS